jgi:hypothetical protein
MTSDTTTGSSATELSDQYSTRWYRRRVSNDDDRLPMPALIREARGAYGLAIRIKLSEIGLSQLPRNSAYVLGAMHAGSDFDSIVRYRRKSLESSGTIDALFATGCLVKEHGETVLTDRGHEAAHVCKDAREALDRRVSDTIGLDGFETMRKGLMSLIDWKEANEQ